LYEKFGIEGLKRIRQKKVYSVQFKLEVLSFYEENRFFRNGNSPLVWYNKPSNDKFMAQGWHYQHRSWVKTLKKNNVFQSMSRKGNCIDNSPMENFFGLLKQEMYHGEARSSYEDLKKKIEEHIDYYNNKRIKQKLAGMSPVQYRIHTCQLAA
ncbi:IS3 family transposase, partial [Alteribacillus bidgolensis]